MKWKHAQLLVVIAGIVLGQFLLYGPSLVGRKVLLPLDILGEPNIYLPCASPSERTATRNLLLSDSIYMYEPARRFAVAEFHAGRLPLWTPYCFAGAPFIWPKFSPFYLLQACTASPVVLAWAELAMALVAGLGAYQFCRRALSIGFWPATIAAWCYPLTGFFVLWQGYVTAPPVVWLPWLLLAVDRTIRRSPNAGHAARWLAPVGLAILTALVLVSGQLDVAGQVLLVSGLYGLWCLFDVHRRQCLGRQAGSALVKLALAWSLGLLLSAPYWLPVVEYTQISARLSRRSAGTEARPPVGLPALPQIVLPNLYGGMTGNTLRIGSEIQVEGSAAAYTGLAATLLLAPLGCCSRRHRSVNLFWGLLALFSLSWCLNLPPFVQLLRLPGLNMMSHNRLVFAAAFAILVMAAVGLEVLLQEPIRWRGWFWAPAGILAGLGLWCFYRSVFLPEPMSTQLEAGILAGQHFGWIYDLGAVRQVQAWFTWQYAVSALWCGVGLAAWLALRWLPSGWQPRLVPALGLVLTGDLLGFGSSRVVQSDPALYYPPLPVLEQVAKSVPGRALGYICLPANLGAVSGLRDVRGYDGVDPVRLIEVLRLATQRHSDEVEYAATQYFVPDATLTSQGELRLPPVLDMLGVRYLIFRGVPPPERHPAFRGNDYWVLVNSNALPRAYVPERVEVMAEKAARLEKLASPQFNPRAVAYLEAPVDLPGAGRGTAEIVEEVPTRVTLSARMDTAGLLVLADRWDQGWRAYVDGRLVPVLRVNHALRGVLLPAGTRRVVFRYEPASFLWGLRLCGAAAIVLLCWPVAFWFAHKTSKEACSRAATSVGTANSPDVGTGTSQSAQSLGSGQ